MQPPVPIDETGRLACLMASQILDPQHDERLNGICKLTKQLCNVPIAMVTLIGDTEQLIRARVGTGIRRTPRHEAFCAYTILDSKIMVVRDAALDPRFRDNFLVTDKGFRFYAGAPLISKSGHALGALCAVDTIPRDLTMVQAQSLTLLAEQVVGLLEVSDSAANVLEATDRNLTQARRHLDSVVSTARVILFAIDDEGFILYLEGPVVADLKLICTDPVGKSAFEVFVHCPEMLKGLELALTGTNHSAVYEFGELVLRTHFSAVPTGCAGKFQVYGFAYDITDQRRLELALARSDRLQTVGRLAAGIAHEINSPIQYICDNVEFLKTSFSKLAPLVQLSDERGEQGVDDGGAQGPEARSEIDFALEQIPLAIEQSMEGINRVTAIVSAMRELSYRGTTGSEYADINEAVRSSVAVTRSQHRYSANIELQLDESLPKVHCEIWEIKQVIVNLIVNAVDAIAEEILRERYDRGTVLIRTRTVGHSVQIAIQDNGAGIPRALHDMLFSSFFTTKEVGKGTGQGLAITRSIIEDKHMGTVNFSSVPGQGTTFYVQIPIDPTA